MRPPALSPATGPARGLTLPVEKERAPTGALVDHRMDLEEAERVDIVANQQVLGVLVVVQHHLVGLAAYP
ncbi:hypothetical protein D3C79_1063150 [compost metagenome]